MYNGQNRSYSNVFNGYSLQIPSGDAQVQTRACLNIFIVGFHIGTETVNHQSHIQCGIISVNTNAQNDAEQHQRLQIFMVLHKQCASAVISRVDFVSSSELPFKYLINHHSNDLETVNLLSESYKLYQASDNLSVFLSIGYSLSVAIIERLISNAITEN